MAMSKIKTFFSYKAIVLVLAGLLLGGSISSCAAKKCDCPSFSKKRH